MVKKMEKTSKKKEKGIVVQTTYTNENYIQFNRVHYRLQFRIQKWFFLVFILFTLPLIYLSFAYEMKSYVMPIFIIVLDIILLLESFTSLLPDLQTKRILKTDHLIDGMVTTYTFYADRFDMKNSMSKGEVPYEKLYRIIETPTYFYLYLNKMSAYLVSKEEFSDQELEKVKGYFQTKFHGKYYFRKK